MGDVPSRSDETRVPREAVSRDGEVAPSSKAPVDSRPTPQREEAGAPQDSDATIIAASPIRPSSHPPVGSDAPFQNTDATIIGVPPRVDAGAATLVSNAAAFASEGPARRTPSRARETDLAGMAFCSKLGRSLANATRSCNFSEKVGWAPCTRRRTARLTASWP